MTTRFSRREFGLGAVSLGAIAAAGAATAEATTTDFDAADVPEGEKRFTYVNVVRNDAANVDVPVGVVNGSADGPTLALTGGIFATEYCGIEAASRLYRDLKPADVKGRVIIVPVVNMPAFQFRTPLVNLASGNNPIDGKSINTLFSRRSRRLRVADHRELRVRSTRRNRRLLHRSSRRRLTGRSSCAHDVCSRGQRRGAETESRHGPCLRLPVPPGAWQTKR